MRYMPCKTRNSSGDEIANVKFRNDDMVHALQNTIDSCMNSATDRRGYVLEHRFTKFNEITQCNKVIQGHRFWYQSKAHIQLPISDSYKLTYLAPFPSYG